MMAAWLSFVAAFAGFGLLSLAMSRHAALTGIGAGRRGRIGLRLFGAAALIVSGSVAFHDNPQLGVIFWSGYAMTAMLLVAGLHAFAERRAARCILSAAAIGIASALVAWAAA